MKPRFLLPFSDRWRRHLSHPDALILLSALGIVTGLLSGLIIEMFRWMINLPQIAFLPSGLIDDFESLSTLQRFLLPVLGSVLIAILFHGLAKGEYSIGVVQVLEKLAYHQGHIPFRSLWLQLFAASLALVTGHSVGREGPGIHLGAATGSVLSRQLQLPNNTTRTLVGCGSAAAIAASFNTPLAGVIFALEVIVQEYTLASFTPVILSAFAATLVGTLVHGGEAAFSLPDIPFHGLIELPFILILGLLAGIASAAFIHTTRFAAQRSQGLAFYKKMLIVGVITGAVATVVPEVMGLGYDTVEAAILGQLGFFTLALIVFAKVFATSIAIGLGTPAGLIGPTLVIGATLGAAVGYLVHLTLPDASPIGLYALLGMGAMMGATLQAPLAALMAVVELTVTHSVIFPGMLTIIIAGLTSSELFGCKGIFNHLLQTRGLDYQYDPILAKLRQRGIDSVSEDRFVRLARHCSKEELDKALKQKPKWVLIDIEAQKPGWLMSAEDATLAQELHLKDDSIDLLETPGQRLSVVRVDRGVTLQEGIDTLRDHGSEALYLARSYAPGTDRIYGVVTAETLESTFRY